ncbi:MAG: hypothetical protein ISR90_02695 [Candidatus Marinimicrobia bacterium]|nr:hypothetical protein [Candidatus Neomarinimicrobiota bacterium]MBL7022949.1 hypothetical protein [Candidatus Neomarinimicrobiota bacterium]MBL7108767.1 hypothetical protein [Candidatus Neomarinimicrobiota bacterium]
MFKLHQNVLIKANNEVVWSFMEDFSRSLSYNRFHRQIESTPGMAKRVNDIFYIQHRFLFRTHPMKIAINDWNPNESFTLDEKTEKEKPGLNHRTTFSLYPEDNFTTLQYSLECNTENYLIDIFCKPIFKAAMIEELLKIKNAIESSVTTHSQSFEPI